MLLTSNTHTHTHTHTHTRTHTHGYYELQRTSYQAYRALFLASLENCDFQINRVLAADWVYPNIILEELLKIGRQKDIFVCRLAADSGACRETFEFIGHYFPVHFRHGEHVYDAESELACEYRCSHNYHCERFVLVTKPSSLLHGCWLFSKDVKFHRIVRHVTAMKTYLRRRCLYHDCTGQRNPNEFPR